MGGDGMEGGLCQLTNNSGVLDKSSAPVAAFGDVAAVAEAHPLGGDSGRIASRVFESTWGLAKGVEWSFASQWYKAATIGVAEANAIA
jgi:hypothetical protein